MVGFIESELQAINAARVAGATDDEIRALVKRLVAERSHAQQGVDATSTVKAVPSPARVGA